MVIRNIICTVCFAKIVDLKLQQQFELYKKDIESYKEEHEKHRKELEALKAEREHYNSVQLKHHKDQYKYLLTTVKTPGSV